MYAAYLLWQLVEVELVWTNFCVKKKKKSLAVLVFYNFIVCYLKSEKQIQLSNKYGINTNLWNVVMYKYKFQGHVNLSTRLLSMHVLIVSK